MTDRKVRPVRSCCYPSVIESSVFTHEQVSTRSLVTTQSKFIWNPKEKEEEEERREREHREKLNAGPYVSSSHAKVMTPQVLQLAAKSSNVSLVKYLL